MPVELIFWLARIVSVGELKLLQLPKTSCPSSSRTSLVSFELEREMVSFLRAESRRTRVPDGVMESWEEGEMGMVVLRDHTMVLSVAAGTQTEKVKREGEEGSWRKPAAKVLLGERRVRFWEGDHGELELEKEVMLAAMAAVVVEEKRRRRNMRRDIELVVPIVVVVLDVDEIFLEWEGVNN